MKYYYSKMGHDSFGKVLTGRNINRVKEDRNKIVVVFDEPIFHVITFKDPILEEEKKVLDSAELVNYIRKNILNVYFFNSTKNISSNIINEVNSQKEQTGIELPCIEEGIYTLNENEILKVNAFIDRETIRESIKEYFDREKSKDEFISKMNQSERRFKKVPFKDFINDSNLLEMYNLPLYINNNDDFVVPTYSYIHSNLFYILNGIYSKIGEEINLSEENLKELYLYNNSEYKDIINKIINNINVKIENRYDVDTFTNSLNYIEDVQKKEHDYTMLLHKAKYILNKAIENKDMIQSLGILDKKKEKMLEKKVTR